MADIVIDLADWADVRRALGNIVIAENTDRAVALADCTAHVLVEEHTHRVDSLIDEVCRVLDAAGIGRAPGGNHVDRLRLLVAERDDARAFIADAARAVADLTTLEAAGTCDKPHEALVRDLREAFVRLGIAIIARSA